MEQFRVGTVTSVKRSTGTCRVTYTDTGATSSDLQVLGCAVFPKEGDVVLTLHMGNGSKGFVFGTYYSATEDGGISDVIERLENLEEDVSQLQDDVSDHEDRITALENANE